MRDSDLVIAGNSEVDVGSSYSSYQLQRLYAAPRVRGRSGYHGPSGETPVPGSHRRPDDADSDDRTVCERRGRRRRPVKKGGKKRKLGREELEISNSTRSGDRASDCAQWREESCTSARCLAKICFRPVCDLPGAWLGRVYSPPATCHSPPSVPPSAFLLSCSLLIVLGHGHGSCP